MDWKTRGSDDYRIFCHVDCRRYLIADECLNPGKGYSAYLYLVDLESFTSNEEINGIPLMELVDRETADEDKAYLIADFTDVVDYETDCFPDQDSMWRYVKDNAVTIIENIAG